MKRTLAYFILISLGGAPAWAMPSKITFQGTLKQKGIPVNVTKNMTFSFIDKTTGATIPGTSVIEKDNVVITNGLFAVELDVDPSIPWEQYAPYIRVLVEGQLLNPDQPLNANLYAVAAIPQGMIAMFASACPVGWTRFSALDNVFPMGGVNYGATGGNKEHSHTLTASRIATGAQGAGAVVGVAGGSSELQTITAGGSGTVSIMSNSTDSQNNIPPFLTIIYCQKN